MKKKFKYFVITFTLLILSFSCSSLPDPTKNIELPSIFSNNMVLQAHKDIIIWGKIDPLKSVKISIAGNLIQEVSDSNGNFFTKLNEMDYGGPYDLRVIGLDTIIYSNVMVGEVWLCSGQSNMEWQLSNTNNAEEEISRANYKNIRLFTVNKSVSDSLLNDCVGEWDICSPQTVRSFSAVGYLFGRELHNNLNIPIGLIHSSWGGTPIEAWMKYSTLENDSIFTPILSRYKDNVQSYPQKIEEYNELVNKIKKEGVALPPYQIDKENKGVERGWAINEFNDSKWAKIELPGFWEGIIKKNIDGALWFRKTIEIPQNWGNENLVVELGPIDDFDVTYFNGKKIGEIDSKIPNFWTTPRIYDINPSLVNPGMNTIAVRVFDHYGQGGFSGSVSQMKIYIKDDPSQFIKLAGSWNYKIETELDPKNVTGPGGGKLPPLPLGPGHPHTPSGLFNAMINPIAPLSLNGFIWYQGETNAGRSYQYRKLLPAMINDWRKLWKDEHLYFGIVQLANYMSTIDVPSESGWAELREAQSMTAETVPKCGLAVTIDIGEADDIHPRNKQDVGKRLAYWALDEAYNQKIFNDGTSISSGPVFKEMIIENDKVRLKFSNVGKEFVIKEGKEIKGFAIAGEDKKFLWAKAEIINHEIIVWNYKISNPIAVRYAWANNPICNLFNSAGLPTVPFRTDNWPGVTINQL